MGRLVDRVGTRPVIVAGTVIVAASMIATGYVTRLWQFYLTYSIGTAIEASAATDRLNERLLGQLLG